MSASHGEKATKNPKKHAGHDVNKNTLCFFVLLRVFFVGPCLFGGTPYPSREIYLSYSIFYCGYKKTESSIV
jgi:hypothetical protein